MTDPRRVAPVDPREFKPDFLATHRENGEPRTPKGRPKKLSAEQAAVIFDAQKQIHSLRALIDRTFDAAGVADKGSRNRLLTLTWKARGRVDLKYKDLKPAPMRRQMGVGVPGDER